MSTSCQGGGKLAIITPLTTNSSVLSEPGHASCLPALEEEGAFLTGFCLPEAARALAAEPSRRAGLLSPAEESLFRGLRSEKRRLDWLAGRGAAKRALARYFREARESTPDLPAIEISSDAQGAPRCSLPGAPSFSISHCAAGGLCAVGRGGRLVGADWEMVVPRCGELARLFARPGELPPGPDDRALTRLWAVKEAVLKLLGLGLAAPPRDVEVLPEIRLHGRARRRWLELGSPELRCAVAECGACGIGSSAGTGRTEVLTTGGAIAAVAHARPSLSGDRA
ncbi:MAG: 4'-phosphopantetheinyl transferase superfamily protein [Elusimicrobia bacterium]|nr:4'-phosphopantetheinyl transferase superfamily protein [Elusimicrobiota bacterium]